MPGAGIGTSVTSDYHQYIYDTQNRQIIGDFEGAYRDVDDVWPSQHQVGGAKFRLVRSYVRPGDRLLDLGCGYGDFVHALRAEGIDACGIEISPSAVAKGKERHGDLPLVAHDVRQGIPFPDGEFQVVVMFGVLWFVLDALDEVLAEIRRVLADDGLAALSVGVPENPIGGEIIATYDDFLRAVTSRGYEPLETLLMYEPTDIASGLAPSEARTDMVLLLRKRRGDR